ncbi:unnamed protein product, partial [Rotaria sp. Silwood1]
LLDSEEQRLNIGSRLEPITNINSIGTSTINDESVAIVTPSSTRQRNKRARIEVDDDEMILTNGNGH